MTTAGRRYRRETLIALVEQIDITVPDMSVTTLARRSIAHYNRRNPTSRPASLASDPDFVGRLMVNFLRHSCSEYDSIRTFLRKHAHGDDHEFVGAVVKGRVLRLIAEKYPMLRAEARSQALREDRVVNGEPRAGARRRTTTTQPRR
ncbi:MAG: hypothetical protein DI630_24360 [Gordonia sp. (in: high G+C Gram-positive bacteria)]|nr:MAG: hypothetical protein DI630_24360 [Gordonia sp. (in: high G+C Gram-positive bacteria)]